MEDDEETQGGGDPFTRIDRSLNRSPFTIFPDSHFSTVWDVITFMIILHSITVQPLSVCFDEFDPEYLVYFDSFSELWFIFDMFLSFNTGFYAKGILVMNRKKIIMHYLQSWFVLDFVTLFPYELIYGAQKRV